MPSLPHEVAIAALRDDPELLRVLLEQAAGLKLVGRLRALQPTIQAAKARGVTPDLAFKVGRSWVLIEVQRQVDHTKRLRWAFALAVLQLQTRSMGELIVLTQSSAVARWCKRLVSVSRGGTRLIVEPTVVLLDHAMAKRLLATRKPELAFFAVWAMHQRVGPAARDVVAQAMVVMEQLPPRLRDIEQNAILNTLNPRLMRYVEEQLMKPKPKMEDSPAVKHFKKVMREAGKAEGKAEGEAAMLLKMFKLKGFKLSAAQTKRVNACRDTAQLERWGERVLTAATLKEVLG
jgi:hypothetical protein